MNTGPDFYTGAPLDPEDLRFRDAFVAELWEMLRLQHVVLSAPRRTGKTSVLDFLAARPSHGFVPIPVFVQDISHPSDFILLMLDLFQEKHPRLFRNLFQASSELIGKAMRSVGEIGVGGFKIQLREKDPDWRNNWKAYGVA